MPVTQVGLVSYQDDPTGSVFRAVYPSEDDSELDDPRWITEGLDPTRQAILTKYPQNAVPDLPQITPWTSVTEAKILLNPPTDL